MKKLTVDFNMGTGYQGSQKHEENEFEFEDDATPEEIEDYLIAAYSEWVLENNDGGWSIIKEEIIPEEDE